MEQIWTSRFNQLPVTKFLLQVKALELITPTQPQFQGLRWLGAKIQAAGFSSPSCEGICSTETASYTQGENYCLS